MRKQLVQLIKPCIFVGLGLLFFPNLSFGQVVNFDQIVAPEGSKPRDFEDYLSQLAWTNGQDKSISEIEIAIAEKAVLLDRKKWMDDISFNFNLNEVSLENVLATDKTNNIVINPLYQFTAGIRLSTLFSNKYNREISEKKVDLIQLESNQKMLKIRQLVLSRYKRLLLAKEIVKVRIDSEENTLTNYNYASERFKNGQLGLEELIRAQESYHNSIEKRLTAETDIELMILEIEELIGIKWEVAERYGKRLKE
ncbi:MAG: outer membrane protein TolC [Paraglaciecola sp.]